MKNNKKGCYLKIYQDPTGGKKDYCIEAGNEFEAFRIAVDFADLITIESDIQKIIEKAKQNEREL